MIIMHRIALRLILILIRIMRLILTFMLIPNSLVFILYVHNYYALASLILLCTVLP